MGAEQARGMLHRRGAEVADGGESLVYSLSWVLHSLESHLSGPNGAKVADFCIL